jgi:hypothetical protein
MREQVLRQFFEAKSTAAELARDIVGSTKKTGPITSVTSVEDMDEDFTVTTDMAVSLCDAVLRGDLPTDGLHTIGFGLMASDRFQWDGDKDEVLANVIADWSCPEINYPLTVENVQQFRAWLTRAEPYPAKPTQNAGRGTLVSVTEKNLARR